MDRCIPANHIIRSDGPPLSRMTILRCSLSAGVLTLEAATLTQEGQSFEESREAIRLSGTLAREGGPMPWLPLLTNGTLRLRGNGWQAQGPVSGGACRVTATVDERLRRVSGDIRCDGLLDDATPPNSRTVEGRFDVFGCER
jgi:hypothetical protein